MVSRRYPTQKKNHTKKDRGDYVADIIEMEGSHHILYLQVTLGTLVLTLREIGREFAQRRDCTSWRRIKWWLYKAKKGIRGDSRVHWLIGFLIRTLKNGFLRGPYIPVIYLILCL